jgi:hypothetical protein
MNTLYRYVLILTACGALLLGVQGPNFVDQYGSIAALIAKHDQSGDDTFKQEARPIRNMLDRYARFTREQAALATGLAGKIVHIIAGGDRELIEETYANYSFTIPLNESAVVSGFVFMAMVVFVIELLRLAVIRLFGRKPPARETRLKPHVP